MEKTLLLYPIWSFAILAVLALVFGYLAQIAFKGVFYGIPHLLLEYPLTVLEAEHPDCRASWLTNGIMLTSLSTGKTVEEIPLSKIHAALSKRGGILAHICWRFNDRLGAGDK